jgi:hypothetical protein
MLPFNLLHKPQVTNSGTTAAALITGTGYEGAMLWNRVEVFRDELLPPQ